jgi:hypothetical protein
LALAAVEVESLLVGEYPVLETSGIQKALQCYTGNDGYLPALVGGSPSLREDCFSLNLSPE